MPTALGRPKLRLRKALVAVCTGLLAALGTDPQSGQATENDFRRGDFNLDGVIDSADAVAVLRFLFLSGPPPACADSADSNDDGSLDIADALGSLFFLFSGGPALPPPGVDCGADPTADPLPCLVYSPCPQPRNPIRIIATSPASGEDRVALTRETVITFSGPLDPTSVAGDAVRAEFAGELLGSRKHLSSSRDRITLFYLEPLPASARVRVTVDGSSLRDDHGLAIDADGDGVAGGELRIDFDTLALAVAPGTAICGRVFASQLAETPGGDTVNRPLAGVVITVDGTEREEFPLRAATDADGNFRLEPAPVGRFFVHVDGSTATGEIPEGAYYPRVGKAWESIPGEVRNVGEIYLPLVAPETLQEVSPVAHTVITFPPAVLAEHPELDGVTLTVPAGSLYDDSGAPGGRVGIAPVPPDRLPGTLPPGLRFALVITVQTDGATNFDVPAPICMPNLPVPRLGARLPPGAKSTLMSFDHDRGEWIHAGTMTVTDDGSLVCTDPGYGILAPGWHAQDPCVPPPKAKVKKACAESDGGCKSSALSGLADCGLSILNSFIPVRAISCGITVALSGISSYRNCTGGDRYDCLLSVSTGVGSTAADCGAKSIPFVGIAVSCLGGAAGIAKNCQCQFGGGAHKGGRTPDAIARIEAWHEYAEAWFDYYAHLFGSTRWLEVPAGRLEAAFEVTRVLREVRLDLRPRSEQGPRLGPTEVINLKRHVSGVRTVTADDIDELAAYVNRTIDLWERGVTTHQAAGRTDFADRDELDSLLARIEASMLELDRLGVEDLDFADGLHEVERLVVEEISEEITDESVEIDPGRLRYRLGIHRGPVRPDGTFEGIDTLLPGTIYTVEYYDPLERRYGRSRFQTRRPGERFHFPETVLAELEEDEPDGDEDGLPDLIEDLLGLDPADPDTDGDGIPDEEELLRGLDPSDGRPVQIGLLSTAGTPGEAHDVDAGHDRVAVAERNRGVSLFNVFNGMKPVAIASVDTPGSASRAVLAGDRLWVADGPGGVAIIDISDPPSARIAHRISAGRLGGNAHGIVARGELAYAGTDAAIIALDGISGQELERLNVPGPVLDLDAHGGTLYYIDHSRIHAVSVTGGELVYRAAAGPDSRAAPLSRLFVGEGNAVAVSTVGYETYRIDSDLADGPLGQASATRFGWRDLVLDGTGLGIAAVGSNGTPSPADNVSVYDVSDPSRTDVLLDTLATPGAAGSVSVSRGLAYVADGFRGLSVVNYRPLDTGGQPPAVSVGVAPLVAPDAVEEGERIRIFALVEDDVLVREVELHLDGALLETDGSYPFETTLVVPPRSRQSELVLQARARDTGGNASRSAERRIRIDPDTTPPRILRVSPAAGSHRSSLRAVTAGFSEPVELSSFAAAFSLRREGAAVVPDQLAIAATHGVARFSEDLPPGLYTASVTVAVRDIAGNSLEEGREWSFRVFEAAADDSDGDCLPDALEISLGLDPTLLDSDDDGVLDGDEDLDGDRLVSCEEITLGTHPGIADTDRDGVDDADELALLTDPLEADSDGDGFIDGEETEEGSNPVDALDRPASVSATFRWSSGAVLGVLNRTGAEGDPIRATHAAMIGLYNEPDLSPQRFPSAAGPVVSLENSHQE